MTKPVDVVLERLAKRGCNPRRSGDGWSARCPAHDDRNPSLSVAEGTNGQALVTCHAACDLDVVRAALGLEMGDLFPANGHRPDRRDEIVAAYDYVDEQGSLHFQVVRFSPKGFRQRRPDGQGGWVWKLGDTRRVLYRLPQVLAAAAAGERVFVTEGEKDADALVRGGAVATTNPGGAGKWRPEYAEALRGAQVIVVADRDEVGYSHAEEVAASVRAVADVVVVEPVVGKDVADHLAAGCTVDELRAIDDEPERDGAGVTSRPFTPVPLDLTRPLEAPRLLCRFLYAGRLTVLQGEPASGKTWLADWIARDLLAAGSRVILFDEEGGEDLVTERLVALGADPKAVAERFTYFAFEGRQWDEADLAGLDEVLAEIPPPALPAALAIFDSLPDFLAAAGLSEDLAGDVTNFVNRVCRRLLAAGVAVLLLDHLKKPDPDPRKRTRSRYARGSGAKLAKADATLLVEVAEEFDATHSGRIRLFKTKDRRGRLDVPGMHSDGLELDVVVEGGRVDFVPRVGPARVDGGHWEGPTECMAAVLRVLEAEAPDELSGRRLVERLRALGYPFREATVREAAERLALEGQASVRNGPRNSRLFRWRPEGNTSEVELDEDF